MSGATYHLSVHGWNALIGHYNSITTIHHKCLILLCQTNAHARKKQRATHAYFQVTRSSR